MLNESGEIGDDNEHIEIDNGLVMAHNVVQETEKTSYVTKSRKTVPNHTFPISVHY